MAFSLESLSPRNLLNDTLVMDLPNRLAGPQTVVDHTTRKSGGEVHLFGSRILKNLRESLKDKPLALIPVHEGGCHWALYTWKHQESRLSRHDSLRDVASLQPDAANARSKTVMDLVCRLNAVQPDSVTLVQDHNVSTSLVMPPPQSANEREQCPQQLDGNAWGVYVL